MTAGTRLILALFAFAVVLCIPNLRPAAGQTPGPRGGVTEWQVVPVRQSNDGQDARPTATPRMVQLTEREYQLLKERVLDAPPASDAELLKTFLVIRLPIAIIGFLLWMGGVHLIRRHNDKVWDKEIWKNPYASCVVIFALLATTAHIIVGLLRP